MIYFFGAQFFIEPFIRFYRPIKRMIVISITNSTKIVDHISASNKKNPPLLSKITRNRKRPPVFATV